MRVRAAGAFVLGAVCSAGVLTAGLGAMLWFFPTALPLRDAPQRSAEERPRPGPDIANWPEIRNGVPDVIARTSRDAAATAAVPSIAPPPAIVAPVEIPPVAAAPVPAPIRPAIAVAEPPPVPDPMLALRSDSSSEAPPLRRESDEEIPALRTATSEAAASGAPAQAGAGDDQAIPALVPLPPRRPIIAEPAPRRPVPPRQRAAAAPPEAASAPAEPPTPQEPARPSILGLPIPDIIPSGQRVKECLLELKC